MIISVKSVLFAILKKSTDNFYSKYRECKAGNIIGVSKRYYDNEDEILQQRRDKNACFKGFDNRIKASDEKVKVNNNLA